ncbi:MAG: tRNA (adenosine(37)-N6)-threonylcarbamoyltransferase complex ATPase subunit type 1 TsaE [Ignavibacteriae bacterium]|nr:tRNA (adenosine(37)-N6)-threonylcarbamoyltransferase complex ATPase subunit type 1 TsaE [Ignavibacteriota bacterium]
MIFRSKSTKDTMKFAKEFAEKLKPGCVLGLKGNLGTGKTQFVKGICEHFDVKEVVNSPTFILVNEYEGTYGEAKKFRIYHFDLYRLNSAAELGVIGFDEYINKNSLVLIEWPELAEEYLNRKVDTVRFDYGAGDDERVIEVVTE